MKIKYLTIDVTDKGTYHPGNTRDVAEAEGEMLIRAKAAVKIADAPENKAAPLANNKAIKAEDNKADEAEEEKASGKRKNKRG